MLIGERGDLGEMGDHEDLVGCRKVGQRRADRVGDVATDTGIDLVENEGGWAGTEHKAERQHGASELTPGGDACERLRIVAGIGREPERHLVACFASNRHLQPCASHRQTDQMLLDGGRQTRSRFAAGGQNLSTESGEVGEKRRALLVEGGSPFVEANELGEPFRRLRLEREHIVE